MCTSNILSYDFGDRISHNFKEVTVVVCVKWVNYSRCSLPGGWMDPLSGWLVEEAHDCPKQRSCGEVSLLLIWLRCVRGAKRTGESCTSKVIFYGKGRPSHVKLLNNYLNWACYLLSFNVKQPHLTATRPRTHSCTHSSNHPSSVHFSLT